MNRFYLVWAFTAGLFFSLILPVYAKRIALVGVPITQTRSTIDSAFNIKLDNNQKAMNRLVIMEDEGKYYWQTRDRRELIFKKMKRFHMFMDPTTGGYIKVFKQEDGRLVYLEHISFEDFRAFTYWGIVNSYKPLESGLK